MKNKVLLIGAGPIIIGQACEFDYSGVQACKILKKYGYKVILINNNPASIMTDKDMSYKSYVEPINIFSLKKIIKLEKPNFIIPTIGGQTSLNLTIELDKYNILKQYNIKILGSNIKAIKNSENRNIFRKVMINNKIPILKSYSVNNIFDSNKIRKKYYNQNIYNLIIRPSYTLGGLGGGITKKKKDFLKLSKKGLLLSSINNITIEESICGFKELELEVLTDKLNKIVVCSIENLDPVGIHTGDSISLSPIQTLTNFEYQNIRKLAFKAIKKIGIKNSGVNVQFAINKNNGRIYIIEINPRLSRSSALASKATGYPIAKVSILLAIGKKIHNIYNEIFIKKIPMAYEPSLDYIVFKSPKFSNEKFSNNLIKLDIQMKSTGESMGIGLNILDSLQKSLLGLKLQIQGLVKQTIEKRFFLYFIKDGHSNRINNVYDSFRSGINVSLILYISDIDPYFLGKLLKLTEIENELILYGIFSRFCLLKIKKFGLSDYFISNILKISILDIFKIKEKFKIFPTYKKIDTCSSEFDINNFYLYSNYYSYNENIKTDKNLILIGSGPNRIGQGLEFDYCCVHASFYLKRKNYNSIIINCNPVTVSTDYDISNKLYFVPINIEEIVNIYRLELPIGLILQYSGQLNYDFLKYLKIFKNIKILGTCIKSILVTENRDKFRKILKLIKIISPKSFVILNEKNFLNKFKGIKLPILIRPSYVLAGDSMKLIFHKRNIVKYYNKYIYKKLIDFPIIIDKFISNSNEFDIDCITNGKNIFICFIIQHIEPAGIHSGDSAGFIEKLPLYIYKKINKILIRISKKLKLSGIFNMQVIIKNNKIYVIEINPRASRTIPYLMKYYNYNLISNSLKLILVKESNFVNRFYLKKKNLFAFKESIFSFNKFKKSDPILGPEMKSTGEIIGIEKNNIWGAFLKTQEFIKNNNNIAFIYNKYNFFIKNISFSLNKINYSYFYINKNKVLLKNILFNFLNKMSFVFIYPDYLDNKLLKKIRIFLKEKNITMFLTFKSIKYFSFSLKEIIKIKIYNL
ncbi:carbamoyl-phosphate synthase large subunit [Candidatus Vidania fulgoroideorum]